MVIREDFQREPNCRPRFWCSLALDLMSAVCRPLEFSWRAPVARSGAWSGCPGEQDSGKRRRNVDQAARIRSGGIRPLWTELRSHGVGDVYPIAGCIKEKGLQSGADWQALFHHGWKTAPRPFRA